MEKTKIVLKELRIEIKINELANNLDIRLLKELCFENSILNIAEYISNGKNLKIEPLDSSFKTKRIAYCLEKTNINSSDAEMDKVLGNNPSNLFYCCLNN